MEEMSPAVAVPFRLGNSICDNSAIATHMEIKRLKLITDTASLLSDSAPTAFSESINGGDESCSFSNSQSEIDSVTMSAQEEEEAGVGAALLPVVPGSDESSWVATDAIIQESEEEEDNLSVNGDQIFNSSCSHSVSSDTSSINGEEYLALEFASNISRSVSMNNEKSIDDAQTIEMPSVLEETYAQLESHSNPVVMDMGRGGDESDSKASMTVPQVDQKKTIAGTGIRGVSDLDFVPLWGSISICGRRPEMEDADASVPRFFRIPSQMLFCDSLVNGVNRSYSHSTAHFFGVYDGHGGSQVANYCRDRLHLALVEELEILKAAFNHESIKDNLQMQWETAFTNCFLKVDDEVGGKVSKSSGEATREPVAPDTVGSTAVVAVICSSHIIVANCGDSRAVLCRGKEPMPLSVDHKVRRVFSLAKQKLKQKKEKTVFAIEAIVLPEIDVLSYLFQPNRDDELVRIEAAGGKVINWDGYRVCAVLAMSRAIGDRYLKPSIIPDPEVMFVPRTREDECLILASDGLWDVMTNEEVCDVARRRILLWHKKNGSTPLAERGEGADPAAQAAAEFLAKLALQKGSKDNITVTVVDLKAQRKFKSNKT